MTRAPPVPLWIGGFLFMHKPVVIIGGGIVGLSLGWQLLRRGRSVTIFERSRAGRAASWVAGGMLAPDSEVGFEEDDFLRLAHESMRQYPGFLDELEEDTGRRIGCDDRGTLFIGFDRDDTERLRRLYDFRRELRLPVQWLDREEAREMEPLLSPRIASAMWLRDDHQINNQTLVEALAEAFAKRGGELREDTPVAGVEVADDGARGIVAADGATYEASAIVLAAGCWSRDIEGIPDALLPPVRPVKGQIVVMRSNHDVKLSYVIRAPDVYVIPKDDGRLLIGASQEEMGFDTTPTAGEVMRLLERGWEAVPAIYDLELRAIDVGLRPGSRDHQPIVGSTPIEGLYYATGHFRHGILLAPATAYGLAALITGGEASKLLAPFAPARFFAAGSSGGDAGG